jgi:CRP-like cAMP-binding protein
LVFRIIKEGDYFGYFPLIVKNKYGNSAACLEDCEYRIIPKEDFLNVLFNNKDFSAQFIKLISYNTSQLESQLIEMAYGSVRKKVANALLAFATKNDDSDSYYIEISRENLSSVAGVAKETLIRTLGDFKREDLIELESKKIKVLNKADIENIIG